MRVVVQGVTVLLMTLCLAVTQSFSESRTIVIATEEYPPYTSTKLKEYGIDSHIISEAFRLEGVSVKYEFYPAARAYRLAQNGVVDATVPWAWRQDRDADFHFSDPIIKSDIEHFYYLKDLDFSWDIEQRDYSVLSGLRVAAIISYNYGDKFQQAEKDGLIVVDRVSVIKRAFKMLLSGRVDLVISQQRIAEYELHEGFSPDQIAKLDHRPENKGSFGYDYLLFSKKKLGSYSYLEIFNRGLQKLQQSGRYDQMIKELSEGGYVLKK